MANEFQQHTTAVLLAQLLRDVKDLNTRIRDITSLNLEILEPKVPFAGKGTPLNPDKFFPVKCTTIGSGQASFWAVRYIPSGIGQLGGDTVVQTPFLVFVPAEHALPQPQDVTVVHHTGVTSGGICLYEDFIQHGLYYGRYSASNYLGSTSIGTVEVYNGPIGGEADANFCVRAKNLCSTVCSGDEVFMCNNDSGWYIITHLTSLTALTVVTTIQYDTTSHKLQLQWCQILTVVSTCSSGWVDITVATTCGT